ncbi:F0F1 ATP synthase subunit delta [Candidatus Thiosymbion oneisti]|uniref:F0F1 ATP synthase subunit delta n=1 Tax=Candidatus Thiosymbion oneisti TaxID=589554 RepID=UPI000AA54CA4|nr:F0F1 ATP synthase subunit delta [Candidatus Thiosymbion oneisti]
MAGDITTIARPYAEAAFARARESEQVDAWGEALATLSAIAADPRMAEQIGNPNLPRERLRDAILEIAGEVVPSEVRNLVSLLAANNRLSTLPEIARLFEALRIRHQGVRRVQVLSTFELGEDARRDLAAALEKRLGAEVEMTVETDPSLIGGVQIRAGDLVIDGSVRGKLHKLATELQF